jgi:hypothetical protein
MHPTIPTLRRVLALCFPMAAILAAAVTIHPARAAADVKPAVVNIGNLKLSVVPPAGWTRHGDAVSWADLAGAKGNFSFLATPMDVDAATQEIMTRASYDQGQSGLKLGNLVEAQWKEVDGIKGVFTIESGKDPDIRRMQWISNARGHYINFTFASTTPVFEKYLPEFKTVLASIKWVK